MRLYKILRPLLLLFVSVSLLRAEDGQELNLNDDIVPSEKRVENKSYYKPLRESIAKVSISSTKEQQSRESLFFQTNIGIGFLYFSGLRANLMGRPATDFAPATTWRDALLKGRLSYNRTPLYEYLLGYQLNSWMKTALSYQYQGGVSIQTDPIWANPPAGQSADERIQLNSNLTLNGIFFKFYFDLPYVMSCKKSVIFPYLAVGVGPAWQSWTDIQMTFYRGDTFFVAGKLSLRQKISANAAWMVDTGFRLQSGIKDPSFSFLLGCKYNQWGQARSMGKMSQQGYYKLALAQPLRIKTVYQFAPYLGLQWNFPKTNICTPPYSLNGKVMNPWIPYFLKGDGFQNSGVFWTQFNVGVGFLYFAGLRGNLMGRPTVNFVHANTTPFAPIFRDIPIKGRLSYNRTPLFEYLLGYKLKSGAKIALSYQYQGGITVQTRSLSAYLSAATSSSDMGKFTSALSLNAILFKFYFNLSPYAMVMKNLSFLPYLAAGIGPGWQSWTGVEVDYSRNNTLFSGRTLPLSQKISANAVWMLDTGFRIQSVFPSPSFSAYLGCKYNQWGQARSIGNIFQQGSRKQGLNHPFRVKTVYQFAPYLGVQWNFPNTNMPTPYCKKGKVMNPWIPYFIKTSSFQCPQGFFTQFSTGVGFLYFSGLRGNLMGRPAVNFGFTLFRDVPIKGRLTYNPTPLFEYLFGYKINTRVKCALSYQHQGGVNVRSKALWAYVPAANSSTNLVQFSSKLSLNAILLKVYFELPYAMAMKGLSFTPYLAVGVGPGWQSWTLTQVYYTWGNASFVGDILRLRQKISANAVWMIDKGFRIQSAYPNSSFSVLVGAKYNQWGQARSLGKMSQQGTHKQALDQPVRIKTVYQFAPYVGVQWLF